jgi:hypothetical protein
MHDPIAAFLDEQPNVTCLVTAAATLRKTGGVASPVGSGGGLDVADFAAAIRDYARARRGVTVRWGRTCYLVRIRVDPSAAAAAALRQLQDPNNNANPADGVVYDAQCIALFAKELGSRRSAQLDDGLRRLREAFVALQQPDPVHIHALTAPTAGVVPGGQGGGGDAAPKHAATSGVPQASAIACGRVPHTTPASPAAPSTSPPVCSPAAMMHIVESFYRAHAPRAAIETTGRRGLLLAPTVAATAASDDGIVAHPMLAARVLVGAFVWSGGGGGGGGDGTMDGPTLEESRWMGNPYFGKLVDADWPRLLKACAVVAEQYK